jgi:hypothetical protein
MNENIIDSAITLLWNFLSNGHDWLIFSIRSSTPCFKFYLPGCLRRPWLLCYRSREGIPLKFFCLNCAKSDCSTRLLSTVLFSVCCFSAQCTTLFSLAFSFSHLARLLLRLFSSALKMWYAIFQSFSLTFYGPTSCCSLPLAFEPTRICQVWLFLSTAGCS